MTLTFTNPGVALAWFQRRTEKRRPDSGAPRALLDSALLYVCNPITEVVLAIEVLAGNGGSVGRDADCGIQGHAGGDFGSHLP